MTLLIDENLPRTLTGWLEAHGIPSESVWDAGFNGKSDPAIAEYAVRNSSIILTKDRDYDDLVLRTPGLCVIRLTAGNIRTKELFLWLEQRLPELRKAISDGSPIVTI